MAITPKQAKDLAKPTAEQLGGIQQKIDSFLVECQRNGYWPGFSVDGFTHAEIDLIIRIYTEQGWQCSTYDSLRDGRFIRFEPAESL